MTPRRIPPNRDLEVTKTVYTVGRELSVSGKVMLAGFEAGWVESRMNNLDFGDRDSLGVFQQRPSQGWGTKEQIMHVPYAATQFFTRAIRVEQRSPDMTPGQTAQQVQRSGFPLRYDQAEAKARDLLDEARRAVGSPSFSARVSEGVPVVVDGGRGMVSWGVAPSGEVIHQWQNEPGGAWSAWTGMGKPGDQSGVGRPAVIVGRDGGMALFARGQDGGVHHRWQNEPGGAWSDWVSMGARLMGDVCVVLSPNKSLSLFGLGEGDRLVHTWQHGADKGFPWHGSWVDMGGPLRGRPAVIVGRDGGMALFGCGPDGEVLHRWQNEPGGAWSDWVSMGARLMGDVCVVLSPNKSLSLFGRGEGDRLVHTWQHGADKGFPWHGSWVDMSEPMRGRPAVIVGRDGGMALFVRGVDDQVHHRWQNEPGGAWSEWVSMGGNCTDDPSAVLNPHGGISLFVRDHAGNVLHTWQHGSNEGFPWHGSWVNMGGPINNA